MNENPWYMNIFNPEIVKKGMEIKEGKITMEEAKETLLNAAWLGTNEKREKTEEAVEMAVKYLELREKINKLIYLRKQLDIRIDNYITEYLLRGGDVKAEQIKESLDYVIDDNLRLF